MARPEKSRTTRRGKKNASGAESSGGDAGIGSQRGRAHGNTKPGAPTKLERVRHVIDLMASGRWVTGQTARELAEEWGLTVSTVEETSAEASRALKLSLGDAEEIKARWIATLEHNAAKASAAGEYTAVPRSLEVAAKLAGLNAPEKIDVGGSLADILALGLGAGGEEPGPSVEK